jgi:hypothetical protein
MVRSMEHALKFYNLHDVEVIRDSLLVNKALVAWGPGVLLLAFRGTANKGNMKQDLQVMNLLISCNYRTNIGR